MPYKRIFREALSEVGVISDLQAIIWSYFERKVFTFGSNGKANGQFSGPYGVCVDKKGLVYVCDFFNNRVQIFTGDGKWLQTILSPPTGSLGYFGDPFRLAVGPENSIYISNHEHDAVIVCQADGKLFREIGSGHIERQFNIFRGIALNADRSLVYIADSNFGRVSVFTSDGKFSHHIGKYGHGAADLQDPCGVAVGPDGHIYVSDLYLQRIQVYTPDGQYVRQMGQRASGPALAPVGYLSGPDDVACRLKAWSTSLNVCSTAYKSSVPLALSCMQSLDLRNLLQ